jgi:hypothetical protein
MPAAGGCGHGTAVRTLEPIPGDIQGATRSGAQGSAAQPDKRRRNMHLARYRKDATQ